MKIRSQIPVKNFQKAHSSFEGGTEKKLEFLVKVFQKVPENVCFGLFFQNLPEAQKSW